MDGTAHGGERVGSNGETVIHLQSDLIGKLKALNNLLSQKFNVLQSTQLSQNVKNSKLNDSINPSLLQLEGDVSGIDSQLKQFDTVTLNMLPTISNDSSDISLDIDESRYYDVPESSIILDHDNDSDNVFQFNMNNVPHPSVLYPDLNDNEIVEDSDQILINDTDNETDGDIEIIDSNSSIDSIEILSDYNSMKEDIIELDPLLTEEDLLPAVTSLQIGSTDNNNDKKISYNWSDEVNYKLNKIFRIQNFRSNQLKAINATLSGKDVFVLMPTGGGKSLCYQLSAIIKSGQTKGTTIVISPLISLMQDQVDHLLDINIKATNLNSKLNSKQKDFIFKLLVNAELDLLYISPEMVKASKKFQTVLQSLYRTKNLSRIVIDEAHCVSNWGHDFRPDYKNLDYFKNNFPDIPIMALTATANKFVINDIIKNLKFNQNNMITLRQSFNRDNLFYQILPKNTNTGALIESIKKMILENFTDQTGIIYCHSKKSCEELSSKLSSLNVKCSPYHAGMSTNERTKVQNMWQNNKYQVICATVAFGMGIDKSDVRFVIHYTIPRSLENYYQESGRAGRDGKYSYCITFYSFRDVRKLQKMIQIDKSLKKEYKTVHLNKLQQVMNFCENQFECRRNLILNYFNEGFDSKFCYKNCDNCAKKMLDVDENSSHLEEKDISQIALDIVKLVSSFDSDRVTVINCQEIFRGSKAAKIVQAGHDRLPEHGLGKYWSKFDLERIFFHLITIKVLQEYSVMNKCGYASSYVRVGPEAKKLEKHQLNILMKFNVSEKRSKTAKSTPIPEEESMFIKVLNYRKSNRLLAPENGKLLRPTNSNNKTYVTTYTGFDAIEHENDLDIVRQLKAQQHEIEDVSISGSTKARKPYKRKARSYKKRGRMNRRSYRSHN